MANTIEVKVPDIGDYSDVPVIEVLVAVGDSVKKDQGLVTLESDKATLEVPSSADGVVKEIKVKVGDRHFDHRHIAVIADVGNLDFNRGHGGFSSCPRGGTGGLSLHLFTRPRLGRRPHGGGEAVPYSSTRRMSASSCAR